MITTRVSILKIQKRRQILINHSTLHNKVKCYGSASEQVSVYYHIFTLSLTRFMICIEFTAYHENIAKQYGVEAPSIFEDQIALQFKKRRINWDT